MTTGRVPANLRPARIPWASGDNPMMPFRDVSVRFALALSLVLPAMAGAADVAPGTAGAGIAFVSFPSRDELIRSLTVTGPHGKTFDLKVLAGNHDPLAGAWLPEADYTLKAWDDRKVFDSPSFHVKAGAATDLGALVPLEVGNYQGAVAHTQGPAAEADAKASLSALHAPDGMAVEAWAPGDAPLKLEASKGPSGPFMGVTGTMVVDAMMAIDRHKNARPMSERLGKAASSSTLLEAAKESALPVMLRPVQDEAGKLYFGAELGQVRVRDTDGTWSTLDTGSLHNVTSLMVTSDLLVAGMGNGTVRVSHDHGKQWEEAAYLDCGGGRIVDIEFSGSYWAATAINGYEWLTEAYPPMFWHTRICAFASDDADLTHLVVRKSEMVDRLKSVGAGSQLTKNAYFTMFAPDLMKLDLGTMTWTKVNTPANPTGFVLDEATGTAAIVHSQGMFSSMYLSTDAGTNWTKIDRPDYAIINISFPSPTEGYAVRAKARTFTIQQITYSYSAAANRWSQMKVLPDECMASLMDGKGKPVFCLTRGGSILNVEKTPAALEYLRD
jgi:hypothetical protein